MLDQSISTNEKQDFYKANGSEYNPKIACITTGTVCNNILFLGKSIFLLIALIMVDLFPLNVQVVAADVMPWMFKGSSSFSHVSRGSATPGC